MSREGCAHGVGNFGFPCNLSSLPFCYVSLMVHVVLLWVRTDNLDSSAASTQRQFSQSRYTLR